MERLSCQVTFHNRVLQAIRQHARSTPNVEICGVLMGRQSTSGTMVNGAIAGEGVAQGEAHVTFTQDTWNRIHEEKDKQYPGQIIVGWYHSHPGFGVFLSDHDIFIQKYFFSDPWSLAWVYDPISDEEGCFGWEKEKVCRLERFEVVSDGETNNSSRNNPISDFSRPLKLKDRLFPWYRYKSNRLLSLILVMFSLLIVLLRLRWRAIQELIATYIF